MDNQRKEYTIDELTAENESLKAEVERLQQQVDMLKKAVFGPKSERKVLQNSENPEQLSLFNEVETEARREESEEVTVPAHKRKKKRSRTEILKDLPTEEVIHEVEDKTCDKCGGEMKTVGKEFVHDELVYMPAAVIFPAGGIFATIAIYHSSFLLSYQFICSVRYVRLPELLTELVIARGNGTYRKVI